MKTIFAVDDDVDFLEELGLALSLMGYRVVTNADPIGAIDQARKLNPDCILFDLRMPNHHGFQFSEELIPAVIYEKDVLHIDTYVRAQKTEEVEVPGRDESKE